MNKMKFVSVGQIYWYDPKFYGGFDKITYLSYDQSNTFKTNIQLEKRPYLVIARDNKLCTICPMTTRPSRTDHMFSENYYIFDRTIALCGQQKKSADSFSSAVLLSQPQTVDISALGSWAGNLTLNETKKCISAFVKYIGNLVDIDTILPNLDTSADNEKAEIQQATSEETTINVTYTAASENLKERTEGSVVDEIIENTLNNARGQIVPYIENIMKNILDTKVDLIKQLINKQIKDMINDQLFSAADRMGDLINQKVNFGVDCMDFDKLFNEMFNPSISSTSTTKNSSKSSKAKNTSKKAVKSKKNKKAGDYKLEDYLNIMVDIHKGSSTINAVENHNIRYNQFKNECTYTMNIFARTCELSSIYNKQHKFKNTKIENLVNNTYISFYKDFVDKYYKASYDERAEIASQYDYSSGSFYAIVVCIRKAISLNEQWNALSSEDKNKWIEAFK